MINGVLHRSENCGKTWERIFGQTFEIPSEGVNFKWKFDSDGCFMKTTKITKLIVDKDLYTFYTANSTYMLEIIGESNVDEESAVA